MSCPRCGSRMFKIADGLDRNLKPVTIYKCANPKCEYRETR